MRRRPSPARRLFVGGGIAAGFAALLCGLAFTPDLIGAPTVTGAPPTALNHIAQKNDRAAMEAAARMREESRREAERADALRAIEDSAGTVAP